MNNAWVLFFMHNLCTFYKCIGLIHYTVLVEGPSHIQSLLELPVSGDLPAYFYLACCQTSPVRVKQAMVEANLRVSLCWERYIPGRELLSGHNDDIRTG